MKDPVSFAHFVQQSLGVPNTLSDHRLLTQKANRFFESHPNTDWETLVKVVEWCRAKRRRPAHNHYIPDLYRYAWADGYFGEYDPQLQREENTDLDIYEILENETDPYWRRKLICASGVTNRRKVLAEWRREHTKQS